MERTCASTFKAKILNIWNERELTYRCCVLCGTAMHDERNDRCGCSKPYCSNTEGKTMYGYKVQITPLKQLLLLARHAEQLFNLLSDEIKDIKNRKTELRKYLPSYAKLSTGNTCSM